MTTVKTHLKFIVRAGASEKVAQQPLPKDVRCALNRAAHAVGSLAAEATRQAMTEHLKGLRSRGANMQTLQDELARLQGHAIQQAQAFTIET